MKIKRRDLMKLAGAGIGAALLPPSVQIAGAQQSSTVAGLQNFLRQSVAWRFNLPPAPVTRPMISWAGPLSKSVPVTTLPSGVVYPISSPLIGGPVRHRYAATLPGDPRIGGLPCMHISRPYVCKGINRSVGAPTVIRFVTDAPVFELTGVVPDGSATSVTTMVDGLLLPTEALSSASRGGGW